MTKTMTTFEELLHTCMRQANIVVCPVWFKNNKFLFVGNFERTDGAIATEEQYESFRQSYAYLHEDGIISRFGIAIGTREDLKFDGDDKNKKTPQNS